jgi:hypothetical protein
MNNLQRIQRFSRLFRLLFLIGAFMTPLLYACIWLLANRLSPMLKSLMLPILIPQGISGLAKLYGFLISLPPMTCEVIGYLLLGRLFRLYGEGKIFTAANVQCFRWLGGLLVGWTVAGLLTQVSARGVFARLYPASPGDFTLSWLSINVGVAVIGGVVLVIAWVMDEGRQLEEEHALTI